MWAVRLLRLHFICPNTSSSQILKHALRSLKTAASQRHCLIEPSLAQINSPTTLVLQFRVFVFRLCGVCSSLCYDGLATNPPTLASRLCAMAAHRPTASCRLEGAIVKLSEVDVMDAPTKVNRRLGEKLGYTVSALYLCVFGHNHCMYVYWRRHKM